MGWFIEGRDDEGLFIGECLGLGFFESSIKNGDCSSKEDPIEFPSREEAQKYLESWIGGSTGCKVIWSDNNEIKDSNSQKTIN